MTTSEDKIRVAVLFGGRSAEHEVSLRSAANVIQYLDKSQFDIVPIGIDKQGSWFLGHTVFQQSLAHNYVSQVVNQNETWFTPEWVGKPVKSATTLSAQQMAKPVFDVIFPVVHGTFCEDGTLQGLLELTHLPYVGCGVLASAIGMDKDVAKRLVAHARVNVAPYLVIKQEQWQAAPEKIMQRVNQELAYPVFVKPANTG
ncbi:MAG TPA: D-alanine--D-alanine ligase A, partial [Gammaproteobacteria bacterium]|nr:D-alanine--D-alanine ligase A [Gammaproteobacteria bacterium]